MLKSVIIRLFLQKEVSALRIRLAEASDALKRIESDVVAIDAEASEETRELAEKILTRVLSSADQVRSRDAGFLHAWERDAYAAYQDGSQYEHSTISYARELIDRTKVFFRA